MNALTIDSMQWARLDHIADVKPIGDDDADCLNDIRAVLEKHGRLGRFGVALLHSHFDLADDEVLMETTDVDRREQFVRPMKLVELEEAGITAMTTILTFDENGYHRRCGCDPRTTGHYHK